jgi:hypothetical protein
LESGNFVFIVGPPRQLAIQLGVITFGGPTILVSALKSDGPIFSLLAVEVGPLDLDRAVGDVFGANIVIVHHVDGETDQRLLVAEAGDLNTDCTVGGLSLDLGHSRILHVQSACHMVRALNSKESLRKVLRMYLLIPGVTGRRRS